MSVSIAYRAPAVPKRVILFGFLLGISLAILGLVGSWLVSNLNSAYQEIVTTQLPSLSLIREISKAQSSSRRLIESIPLNRTRDDIRTVRENIIRIRAENGKRLADLEKLLSGDTAGKLIARLHAVRVQYHRESDKFLDVLIKDPDRVVWEVQLAAMIDVDLQYVEAQNRLAEYCEQTANARSDDLTQRSRGLNRFFFVVTAWPLILAAGFFIYGLITTLALFYRSRSNL